MENHKFYQNKGCKFFPCHDDVEEKNFNCLFCFCPLYFYDDCGGNYELMENDHKDCSNCTIPHSRNGYEYIINKISEIMEKNEK